MWKDLTIGQKSEVMRLAVQQGFSDLNNIKEMYDAATSVYNTSSNNTYDNVPYNPSPKDVRYDNGGMLSEVIITPDRNYNVFLNSLPPNQRYGDDSFNTYRYWELHGKPTDFEAALKTNPPMYTLEDDGYYHADSVAYNKDNDTYEFMKSPDHPTVDLELLQYWNNPDLEEFRNNYGLDLDSNPYKYIRRGTTDKPLYAYGGSLGNIYQGRGNKSQKIFRSSNSMRKRISDWEGESMYKPATDTGKVNNPFEVEEAGFWSAIPSDIKPFLTQDMLDALFSTSYNIGSGNFKRRVVPELRKLFIEGTGSVEDVKKSMYGTRDKEAGMSGLRTRRAAERQMFEDAFNAKYPKGFTLDRVPYKTTKANSSVKWDGKKSIQENLESLGVKFIPTSGYRSPKQQSKFKTPASKSWHTHLDEYGNSRAIDIVPAKGMTFDDLRAQLMSPEVQAAFTTYGLGVLDETNTAMKKKTGATGNHFHIGPDKSARAGYAAWINSKMPNGPQINIESPVFYTTANDLQWQPSIVASSRQEDIAPLLVQDNKPLIVEPLEVTSSTPKDFSAIWDQIFPKVENTQEEFNPLLDPSTQFTALQSRPRYQMKPTPIINMPVSNGDNDYMLFKPLARGGRIKGKTNDGSRDIQYNPYFKRWTWGSKNALLPLGHRVKMNDGYEYQLNSDGTKTRIGKIPSEEDQKVTRILHDSPSNNVFDATMDLITSAATGEKQYYNGLYPYLQDKMIMGAPLYAARTGNMSYLPNDDTHINTNTTTNNPLLPRKLGTFYDLDTLYLPKGYENYAQVLSGGISINKDNVKENKITRLGYPTYDARNHDMQLRVSDSGYLTDFSDVFDTNNSYFDNKLNPIIFSQYNIPTQFTNDTTLINTNRTLADEIGYSIGRQLPNIFAESYLNNAIKDIQEKYK